MARHFNLWSVTLQRCTLYCIWVWSWLSTSPACAQEEAFKQAIEEMLTMQDEGVEHEELAELLYQRYANPIDLNVALSEELAALTLLSERQIHNFLRYRKQYGALLSVYELQLVPAWDAPTIQKILPFVIVAPESETASAKNLRQAVTSSRRLLLYRHDRTLEQKKGFLPDSVGLAKYAGSPHRVYTRFRTYYNQRFSAGFTLEKDAGEQLAWRPAQHQYGADFWSAHVYLAHQGRLKQAVVGDYHLRFGQGLVFGAGFGMGKGAGGIASLGAKQVGIRPYTSAMEQGFFRGTAATYAWAVRGHSLEVTGFYSRTRQDAKIGYDSMQRVSSFTTQSTTGYHRTTAELTSRKQLGETAWGAHWLFNSAGNRFHAGAGYLATRYSAQQLPDPQLYRLYEFAGFQNMVVSTHADFTYEHWSVYAEAAASESRGKGVIAGLTAYFSSAVQMAWVARHYTPNFHSFYGNVLSENARPVNEKGLYWAIDFRPWKRMVCSAYYDHFAFPWLRYGADAPGNGFEYVVRATYEMNANTRLGLQLGAENKAANVAEALQSVMPGLRETYRLKLQHTVHPKVQLQTRWQMTQYTLNNMLSQGYAAAQDVTLDFGRLRADIRYAIFQTDYATRQYIYEQDVLYAFSIPAYNGEGIRSYILLRYQLNRYMDAWLRVAQWQYDNRTEMGSGLETIEGSTRSDVRFQLALKF